MKPHLTYGFATLLGVASSAWAIEPPSMPAPIPPQLPPEEAAAPRAVEQDEQPEQAPAVEAMPVAGERAYLGVGGSQVPELLGEHLKLAPGLGVVVRSLDPSGPAAKAGLGHNDVITKISGEPVGSHEQLRDAVTAKKPGDEIDIDYIHRGEPKVAHVVLGGAPDQPGAVAGELKPLERLMLDGMPQDQARRIQDAIQQNLRAFEDFERGAMPEDLLGGELRKRVEKMMMGLDLEGEPQGGINLKSSGTIRMLNADGSGVELLSENGGKQVRVLGKGGKVEWEGPYDTEQDKAAVPQEYRDRIDDLNIDMDFKGQGLRLRMVPRFRPEGE